MFGLLAWPLLGINAIAKMNVHCIYLIEHKCTPNKFNAMISSCWSYLIILSSDCQWPTDQPTEWLAGRLAGWLAVRKLKFAPFWYFFPLCIICRYLLDSQDQHVSLGRSALDRNLVNMDGSWRTTKGICYLISTLWKEHRDLMYL